ncbi:adenylate/guanylate cyclase domain-containing protein [Pollutibacter soli]|uniref:adenylate/guanylate cyclase domain-containing protein n=1 Tax=Pollutibacter soli TaxID=3034157 RepID=UPI003013EA48
MGKLSLKNIIQSNKELGRLLDHFQGLPGASLYIEDAKGIALFGLPDSTDAEKIPIESDSSLLGWVTCNEQALLVADMLRMIVNKEQEKKKLGAEVLNMYQEVNLMFNFAGKLAQAIEPAAIAQITLEEAGHVIRFAAGWIIIWDEKTKQLNILASEGLPLVNKRLVLEYHQMLQNILLDGQSEIMSDLSELKETGIIAEEVNSLIFSSLKVNRRVMGAIVLAHTEADLYHANDLKLLTTLAQQSSTTIESAMLYEKNIQESREKEEAMRKIYAAAGKFVPFEFLRSLGREVITDVRLGDQVEKIVTVLFTDIRGYTTIAEKMTPAENFNFVCDFNLMMGPVIRSHSGFINQYLGDAIMAIFPGSPGDALAAAVEIEVQVRNFNERWTMSGRDPIRIGIGMHTGPLIMGITGDQDRMDAATISDTVNTASRIESLTKYYKSSIILSEATLQHIADNSHFHFRPLGRVRLKGKHEAINIHECFSGNEADEKNDKLITLPYFTEGMHLYLNRSFESAISSFRAGMEYFPTDHAAKLFISNALNFLNHGVPDDWSGVEHIQVK